MGIPNRLCITIQPVLVSRDILVNFIKQVLLQLAYSLAVLSVMQIVTAEERIMTDNQKYLTEAKQYATLFIETKDPDFLKQAYETLSGVEVLCEQAPDFRLELRAMSLKAWLKLIVFLDESLDPEFNPDDVPSLLVEPPVASDGVIHRPGTDPVKISDPDKRAEYEKAIIMNRKKAENYSRQIDLRRLDKRIVARFKDYIRSCYTELPMDQLQWENAIENSIKNNTRQQSLIKQLAAVDETQ